MMVADILSGWLIISSHFPQPIKQLNFQLLKEPTVKLLKKFFDKNKNYTISPTFKNQNR